MSAEEPTLPDLVESLRLAQQECWQHGDRVAVEVYLSQHPELLADPGSVLQLVYNEVLLREDACECPGLEEYVKRLPQFADQLAPLFEVHQAIESDRFLSVIADPPPRGGLLVEGHGPRTGAWPTIADHEILGELGRGGMGVVYKAQQKGLNRIVAVKMILVGSHSDPARQARFRTEAEAVARLQHPNIVQIHQVGGQAGVPYYSMEFVDGRSLAQELNGTPLPARQAATLVQTLARAIHEAHQKGIIHRDLKPANILLAHPGGASGESLPETRGSSGNGDLGRFATPKISDFGLAKLQDAEVGQTGSGVIVGTPSYMAPEQAKSNDGQIGPATDVYSLGAILYELLTGRPPFKAQTQLETLRQVIANEPLSMSRLDLKVPRDLETVCQKCLRKEPRQRYGTALELSQDLERFLTNKPILARRTPVWERAWRWRRRNPGWAAALALLVAIAVGTSVVSLELNAALVRTGRAEKKATNQLFEALVTRVQAGRGSGRPGQRFAGLDSIRQAVEIAHTRARPAADLLQLRKEAIACLALPDLRMEVDWEGNPPGTNGLNFDGAFERYAWSFKDEGIRVCRLKDHVELCRLPTPPATRVSRWASFRFSPSGRYLAAHYHHWAEKQSVEIWDISDGKGRRVANLPDATELPVFLAREISLVTVVSSGEAVVIDLPDGRERQRIPLGGQGGALALQPGEKLLAVGGEKADGVRLVDLASGSVVRRLAHPEAVANMSWSPDGKTLATACLDNRIHLWDATSWREQAPLTGHRWEVDNVAFDPSGRWLASFGWDMTLRVWEVATRRQIMNLEEIRVLDFRSQGGLAVSALAGRKVQIWSFWPSDIVQELHPDDRATQHLRFSPDSRWLATGGFNAELRLWDLDAGREVLHRSGEQVGLWGPEGGWVIVQSEEGLSRVPVRVWPGSQKNRPRIQFGQPQRLAGFRENVRGRRMGWLGPPGRRFFLVDYSSQGSRAARIRVFGLEADRVRLLWEARIVSDIGAPAADEEGRFLTAGSYSGGNGVIIWDAETGRLVRELPVGDAEVAFSADGSRLFTTTARLSARGAECRSWSADSWEPDRAVPVPRTVSSAAPIQIVEEGTVAIAYTSSDVRLLDPDTLEELATLVAPEPAVRIVLAASPDSSTLAVVSSGTIHLWKLRRLRAELAAMGLDWSRDQHLTSKPK
jgi:WD40 repeat protein